MIIPRKIKLCKAVFTLNYSVLPRILILKYYLVSDKLDDKIQSEEGCVVYPISTWVSWPLWPFIKACNPPNRAIAIHERVPQSAYSH